MVSRSGAVLWAILGIVSETRGQHYFGGIGKNTWAASNPPDCIDFFFRYLPGVQRESNECANDTCTCGQQARVNIPNVTGTLESYDPFGLNVTSGMDLFGIHAVDCSYHPSGACSLEDIEQDFQDQFGDFDGLVPLMEHNILGLWASSLGNLTAAFQRDGVRFLPMTWDSNGTTYFSLLVNPCGIVLLEFISDVSGEWPTFHPVPSRLDFDLPHTIPAPPSTANPLQLTPLKVARAASTSAKLDELLDFYRTLFNATLLRRGIIEGGAERMILKLPDVTTGVSAVQLHFTTPPLDAGATAPQDTITPTVPASESSQSSQSSQSCSNWTVASYEAYLSQAVRQDIRSPTCGFPTWLDMHFSFDCVDPDCVLDDVADKLEALDFRWLDTYVEPYTWWLLYFPDPTGYAVETHYLRWVNTPDPSDIPPSCFGAFANGSCAGAIEGQCT